VQLTDDHFAETEAALPPLFTGDSSWTRAETALDQAAFAACMARLEPFEDRPLIAVAVSGGADSLALTLLADDWARRRDGRVVGLTVDHGLRPGSAEEARQTGLWLGARKIEHHRLHWTGAKPKTGLQRRAREARYRLLTDWCRQRRCLHLMTAHHRADQAETVALRKARQSGDAGLAAMSPVRELRGLRLLRPLLGVDRARLEAALCAMAQPWLDDPSNHNAAYTRVRLRQAGLDIRALADEAERQGLRRQTADRRAAAALVQHAIIDPAGFATLNTAGFDRLSTDLALDLLTRLLMTIGGRIYPPRRQALSRLFAAMRAEPKDRPSSFAPKTLAHCRILRHRDRWLICRERASSERRLLAPSRQLCWDDRFVVSLRAQNQDLAIAALGDKARHGENTLMSKEKNRSLPGVVKPGLPAIWRDERLMAIPHLGLYDLSFVPEALNLRFCPPSPLANAPFLPHISG